MNVMDCFCIDADTRRGPIERGGGAPQKKGGGGSGPHGPPGSALEFIDIYGMTNNVETPTWLKGIVRCHNCQ